MRIARLGMLGALLFAAAACQTDDGGATIPNIPPLAFVRYINAVPDTMNTTVRWVDEIQFTPTTFVNVPFRGLGQGNYQGLEAGSRRFRVFTFDPTFLTTDQLADTAFTFVAGQYYTLLHTGYARAGQLPAQRVVIINDALPAANNTQVNVRALNANSGVPSADLYLTAAVGTAIAGTPAFSAVAYEGVSAYSAVAPSSFGAGRYTAAGSVAAVGSTAAPAGVAGTATASAISGSTVGGSVLTAITFPAVVPGSRAATVSTANATATNPVTSAPSVIFIADRQPTP